MIQKTGYLHLIQEELALPWPHNRCINIVCHGHSVPAGYFSTPYVNPFQSYPHLLHQLIKNRFPYAVTNVIITAIGGENSMQGATRFKTDVLTHKPDVIIIDYSLNDRSIGLKCAAVSWETMINQALEQNIKVILCTPSWDDSYYVQDENWRQLVRHAEQVRALADRLNVGLADSFASFERHVTSPEALAPYLSHVNHPSEAGHRLIAQEIANYFVAQ